MKIKVLLLSLLLIGCAHYEVTDNQSIELIKADNSYRTDQPLLNVGIARFSAKLQKKSEFNLEALRQSESIWYANQLKQTMDRSNVWGSIWVLPNQYKQAVDLNVVGTIIASNGERVALQIRATDATNKEWLRKEYTYKANAYIYNPNLSNVLPDEDPFQNLFNQIANDLYQLRIAFDRQQALGVKDIADMRFAYDLAPQNFQQYLSVDNRKNYQLNSLPALNDPNYKAIQRIAVRNDLFLDIVQDHYRLFANNMGDPYQNWRATSYADVVQERRLKRQARLEKIGGLLAVGAGIAVANSIGSNDSSGTRDSKRVVAAAAIGAGASLVRSGFQKADEASLYRETLIELGESIEAELEPTIFEVDDKTITLTGTIQQQFEEWRELLLERYQVERGIISD